MADIINSVDRSLDMYIYDLYIYRYISLSIYRSIFLYLFWLADIFASVERPDNKNLHLADMILIKLSNLLPNDAVRAVAVAKRREYIYIYTHVHIICTYIHNQTIGNQQKNVFSRLRIGFSQQ